MAIEASAAMPLAPAAAAQVPAVFAQCYAAPEGLPTPFLDVLDGDRRVSRRWAIDIPTALKELLPDVALGTDGLFWGIDRIGYLGELRWLQDSQPCQEHQANSGGTRKPPHSRATSATKRSTV
jgi:hypothetical protein